MFKAPNNFVFGGTSGVAILLTSIFPGWDVGAFMWLVNGALVALGFLTLGRAFAGWTVYSSLALSFYVSAAGWLCPMAAPFTSDRMLEMVFAVLLPAVGSAMAFHVGRSVLPVSGSRANLCISFTALAVERSKSPELTLLTLT